MSLAAVAKQAGIAPEPRVLHQRPELIQELMWLPPRVLDSSQEAGSVRKIIFRFYNGQLFRMVIGYDGDRTEGLTVEDVVQAISAKYRTCAVTCNRDHAGVARGVQRP